jgi:hypothetical protein
MTFDQVLALVSDWPPIEQERLLFKLQTQGDAYPDRGRILRQVAARQAQAPEAGPLVPLYGIAASPPLDLSAEALAQLIRQGAREWEGEIDEYHS